MAILATGCDALEDVRNRVGAATPREAYLHGLENAGLLETALARDWVSAGDLALQQALDVTVPVEEAGYLDSAEPRAVAVRLPLQRGQRVTIRADLLPAADALLFLDVFRIDSLESAAPRFIAAADSGGRWLEFEPARTAPHIVRLQPELLRGGRYLLSIRSSPALSFPVSGMNGRAIGSRYGAPRDGGAREHKGVDIFAPRGTPVVAAARGVVNRVGETPIGGRVVWLRDERRSLSLYYAHLDTQLVTNGTQVEIGDTLGTVGNTGNARTTPPHLHFGIYRRGEGAIDPFAYVYSYHDAVPRLRADTSLLGSWARSTASVATNGREVEAGTPFRVRAASGDRFRVELPDRTLLWLPARTVERAAEPVRSSLLSRQCTVRARPAPNSAVVTALPAGKHVSVLGHFGDYALVRIDSMYSWSDCV
jgi:peptidoglycan LD-endopeptidase LytH